MRRKLLGIALIFIALEIVAMVIAGSHGHYKFNPRMAEDWVIWGLVLILFSLGLRILLMRKKPIGKKQ